MDNRGRGIVLCCCKTANVPAPRKSKCPGAPTRAAPPAIDRHVKCRLMDDSPHRVILKRWMVQPRHCASAARVRPRSRSRDEGRSPGCGLFCSSHLPRGCGLSRQPPSVGGSPERHPRRSRNKATTCNRWPFADRNHRILPPPQDARRSLQPPSGTVTKGSSNPHPLGGPCARNQIYLSTATPRQLEEIFVRRLRCRGL